MLAKQMLSPLEPPSQPSFKIESLELSAWAAFEP
jgi:hypothetical protein